MMAQISNFPLDRFDYNLSTLSSLWPIFKEKIFQVHISTNSKKYILFTKVVENISPNEWLHFWYLSACQVESPNLKSASDISLLSFQSPNLGSASDISLLSFTLQ